MVDILQSNTYLCALCDLCAAVNGVVAVQQFCTAVRFCIAARSEQCTPNNLQKQSSLGEDEGWRKKETLASQADG